MATFRERGGHAAHVPEVADWPHAQHGIRYPLLSDDGSHTMRGLGVINERVHVEEVALVDLTRPAVKP